MTASLRTAFVEMSDEDVHELERWQARTGLDFTQVVNEMLEASTDYAAERAAAKPGSDDLEIVKRKFIHLAVKAVLQEIRDENARAARLH